MKKILLILFTLMAISVSVIISGCQMEFTNAEKDAEELKNISTNFVDDYDKNHYPVTVENVNYRNTPNYLVYNKPPERVIAVWQNSIETLLALGVGDRIIAAVGLPDKKYLLPEYQEAYEKIPIKSFQYLDVETVMMLQPDFILGWWSTFSEKVLRATDFWNSRGVNTYIAKSSIYAKGADNVHTLDEEYKYILDLGKIFDKQERANAIVDNMKAEINYVQGHIKDSESKNGVNHPRALIVEMESKGFRVYGKNTLAGDILQNLGGELLASDSTSLGAEEIVDLNPDAIFLVIIESNYGKEQTFIDMVKENPAMRNLKCVQENRVYTVPLFAVYSSGIRTYDGIKIMAQGLYPDLYKER